MRRRTRPRSQHERDERSVKSDGREFKGSQIVVKVDNSMTCMIEAAPNGVTTSGDVYVIFEEGVLRRSDEVKARGISDGSIVQVTSNLRGRGKRGQEEQSGREQAVSQKRLESLQGRLEQEPSDSRQGQSD